MKQWMGFPHCPSIDYSTSSAIGKAVNWSYGQSISLSAPEFASQSISQLVNQLNWSVGLPVSK